MRPLPRLLRYAPKAREGTLKLHFYLESIVSPKNAKRGKACALPLFAKAKIGLLFGFAKTRCFVPRAGKARRGFGKDRKSVPAAFTWF